MGAENLDVESKGSNGSVNNKVEALDAENGIALSASDQKNILSRLSPQKKRKLRKCCICCGIPVVMLAVFITALSQTIFKFRDPDITLTDVKFSGVKFDHSRPLSPSSVNASISANMYVYNPNRYNFRFKNSTIHVVYHEVVVGNISMPAGEVRSRKTVALPALVTVGSLKLGRAIGNVSEDIKQNLLPFAMSAMIPGRVNVVNIIKHNVVLEYHCDVNFWIRNATLKDYLCWRKVHM